MKSQLWKRIGIVLGIIAVVGGIYFAWMMMPGGALTGTPAEVPADWTDTEVADIVEIESNPAAPYSVKIWVVPLGANLYIHAGANHTAWVKNIETDPLVRMKSDDRVYDLTAARVNDAEEFATFANAYEARYNTRPRNENVGEVYLFRLTARQ